MYEKVNPSHPDKVADRIAGAVVDLCYQKNENPRLPSRCLSVTECVTLSAKLPKR
jgi:S-adenosylmethionine synthetase